ncbi:MAG: hypothetical protein ACYTEQ_26375 [Planctomycetota bacterium]|jgi:hypothetical protein
MGDEKAVGSVPFEVKIDPQQVNEAIVQAVLESQIGDKVREAASKALEKTGYPARSVIDDVIYQEVKNVTAALVRQEHEDELKRLVRDNLTMEKIEEVFTAVWKRVMDY